MKFKKIIRQLQKGKKPLLAVLIDPDKFNTEVVRIAKAAGVSCFLVGGSVLNSGDVSATIETIKGISDLPVILFPGDEKQLSEKADGLLLLSLLSGRNPEYLIEKHVLAAPVIKAMKLRFLATAYLLIGRKTKSSTQVVTKTNPLDSKHPDLIVNTALAAEQLGFGAVYLEAGSGSGESVPTEIIKEVRQMVEVPIIVGGGLNSKEKVKSVIEAGANMVVIGNALEKNVYLLT